MFYYKYIYFTIFICGSLFSQNRSVITNIDSLIFYKEALNIPSSTYVKNNLDSAIYLFIDRINLNKKRLIGHQDIYSSFIAPNPNYIGINCIYFLEIIFRDSLSINKDLTKIKLFRNCVLVSKKKRQFPLTIEDMNYIKSIYIKWNLETKKMPTNKKITVWKSKYSIEVFKHYEWI